MNKQEFEAFKALQQAFEKAQELGIFAHMFCKPESVADVAAAIEQVADDLLTS